MPTIEARRRAAANRPAVRAPLGAGARRARRRRRLGPVAAAALLLLVPLAIRLLPVALELSHRGP